MARVIPSGGLSGLMGNVILRNYNGNIYASVKPQQIRNPRTQGQQLQRLKLRNIINLYGCMKEALKDNFQGKTGRQSDYSRFQGCNLSQPSIYLPLMEADIFRGSVVAPYVVSFGTLPSIEYQVQDGWIVSNVCVGEMEVDGTTPVKDLASAVISNNEQWRNGDVLQLIVCCQEERYGDGGWLAPDSRCRFVNIPLKTDLNVPLARILGGIEIGVNDQRMLSLKMPVQGGAAMVHKRGEGRDTVASVQTMAVRNTLFDRYHSEEYQRRAIESYAKKK